MKSNILLFSNSVQNNYGYSVVAEKVVDYLKHHYNVFCVGMQSIHPPRKKDGVVYLGINSCPFGSDSLKDYLLAYDIDVLITMFDIWVPNAHYVPQTVHDTGVKWIAHVTLNTTPLNTRFKEILQHAHLNVAPSEFVFNELKANGYNNTVHIPHGVDLELFKPKKKEKDDGFIFFSTMRNKGGIKDFPALFTAYRSLLDRSEQARKTSKLIVLSDPTEVDGQNLYDLRKMCGLESHLQFVNWTPSKDNTSLEPCQEGKGFKHFANNNFSRETMVELYNLADCCVSSSAGESFNLPALESLACGVPIIVSNNTTGPELTDNGKCGLLSDIQYPMMNGLFSYQMHVSKDALSKNMETMMMDKELRDKMILHGLEHVKKYSWEFRLPLWKTAIDNVLNMPTDYGRGVSGI